jgi:hypothetical protein
MPILQKYDMIEILFAARTPFYAAAGYFDTQRTGGADREPFACM